MTLVNGCQYCPKDDSKWKEPRDDLRGHSLDELYFVRVCTCDALFWITWTSVLLLRMISKREIVLRRMNQFMRVEHLIVLMYKLLLDKCFK